MKLYEQVQNNTILETLHTLLIEHYNVSLDELTDTVLTQFQNTDILEPLNIVSNIYCATQSYFNSNACAIFNIEKIDPATPELKNFLVSNVPLCVKQILPQDIIMSVFDTLESYLQKEKPSASIYALNENIRFLGFNSLAKLNEDMKDFKIRCSETDLRNHLCVYDHNQLRSVIFSMYKQAKANNHFQIIDLLSFKNSKTKSEKKYSIPACGANVIYLLLNIEPSVLKLINKATIESNPQLVENHIATLSKTLLEYYDYFWDDASYYYVYDDKPHALPYYITDEILLQYRLERLFHRNFIYHQTLNCEKLIKAYSGNPPQNPYRTYCIKDFDENRLTKLFLECSKLPNIYSQNSLLTFFIEHSSQYELYIDYNRMKWLDHLEELVRYTNKTIYPAIEATFFYLLYTITDKLLFRKEDTATPGDVIKKMYKLLNSAILNRHSSYFFDFSYTEPILFENECNGESKILYQIISKALIHKPVWNSKAIKQTSFLAYSLNDINLTALRDAEYWFSKKSLLSNS